MKRRHLICLLLAMFLLVGCTEEIQKAVQVPQATPTAEINPEVLPGIYMSDDLANFPFPASGYDVYVVGEMHGNQETKQLFQTYLKNLYAQAGVRDVILEEHPAYEPDANEYVRGKTDVLPEELCRRTDILGLIREFNATLPEDGQVTVHLVDVDSPLFVIYKHLTDVRAQLGTKGASIQIPPLSEMEAWSPKLVYGLMDSLQSAAADQPEALKQLETLRSSFRWYFLGNELDGTTATMSFAPLREAIITQNIQNLISRLNGRPVLAFFGYRHAMKLLEQDSLGGDIKSWAQRLSEAGIDVYSLSVNGISGKGYWRGEVYDYVEENGQYQLEDGSFLLSLFEKYPDAGIIYVDLRMEQNKGIKMLPPLMDLSVSQLYDGLVVFKQLTAMENACKVLDQ